ncbi:uncharacterized protein N7515_002187 [Penicillium bovifimosum]|uniref:Zn(2)-C6 fungal-type domain-containing protein n=1 Tax=Penicillium bovifimosum TaxID=126998 RepID=A0A9W9L7U7_9EURO|nr:uncharacterized protein N7515_002187 [Penicillium bovifimosum]KAJ5143400.1 hypothetical protein N7515_002187 [Penicillium bovifimosum]
MLRRTRRAPTACSWCHQRKVRCDASILGSPCTRCRQDGRRECVLRAKTKQPLSSEDPAPPAHQNAGPNGIKRARHNMGQPTGQRPSSHIRSPDNFSDSHGTSPPSRCPNVLHTEYSFVDSQQLRSLPSEDLLFLASKDCLTLPGPDAIDEFVEQYFKRIHPSVPVLDEASFWNVYSSNQPSGSKISLFVLQSLLFASCPLVSLDTLRQCGFKDRRDARKQLYNRAKLLFELRTEKRSHANAQGAVLLTHYTSAADPQAGSLWVTRAIEHAMLIDAQPSLLMEDVSLSLKKRLWWSILLRDRSLCIGLRRRPQVTSINFQGWSDWLSADDFTEEMHQSRVYDYDTKRRLFAALQKQCELAVLLTDLVSLAFIPKRTPRRFLSMAEFQGLLSRIKTIKKSLDEWKKPAQPLMSPHKLSTSEGSDAVATLTYLTYMYYYAARVDLAQYSAFILEENLFYAGDKYSTMILDIGNDLRNGIDGLSLVMEHFSVNGHAGDLPLSVLGYVSMPLVLAAINLKLSPSREEMEKRQKRLSSLSQIIRHSEALYDVTDFVAIGTNHILQLAYATTQNLFLEEKKPQLFLPQTETNNSLSSPGVQSNTSVSMSFKPAKPSSWQEAFIRCPRAYLLISTCVDYSLAIGRLPSASSLPEIVRDLPAMGVIARLPWTSEIPTLNSGSPFSSQVHRQHHPAYARSFSADRRDSPGAVTIDTESEQSPPQHAVQMNYVPSPERYSHYPATPPMMTEQQLQYISGVSGQASYEDSAPNLDFMALPECQDIPENMTETCVFKIPLELMGETESHPLDQSMLDGYGANTALPPAIKAIESTLFDSFFHEAFEQNWAVS